MVVLHLRSTRAKNRYREVFRTKVEYDALLSNDRTSVDTPHSVLEEISERV